MSFISPSQKSTGAKIAFFEQLPTGRRRKGTPRSKRGNGMASPTYQALTHRLDDGDVASVSVKKGSRSSPRSTRSPLGIMISPGFWPHGSYESVASSSSSSSPIPALPMVTPERFDSDHDKNGRQALGNVTSSPRSSSSAVGNEGDVLALLQKHVLDLAPDVADDRAGREEKFHLLQTKLHTIQHGLLAIERERRELVEKCQRLESEKVKVKKQLENREREIVTLSQRCAEQTAQVREATLIRREHRDLNSQVQDLKHELSMSDVKDCQVFKDLKKQLLECQQDRDRLQNRLGKLQTDYDNVSDSLQECMQKIAVLNGKQQQWQDSQAMHERATNQQRLQHTMVVQRLQRTLSSREDEVQRLMQLLKSAQATYERQMEEAVTRDQAIIGELKEENRRLAVTNGTLQQSIQRDFEDKIDRLQADVAQRDELIAKLVGEVEVNMKHLMSTNSSLQRAEEDSRMFLALTADIEALQQEQESLQDQLHERDTTIAELSAQVIRMEMERTLDTGFWEPDSPLLPQSADQPITALKTLTRELRDAGSTIQQLQDQLDALRQENHRLSQAVDTERDVNRTTTEEAAVPESEVGSELIVLERQIVKLVAEKRTMETTLALRNDEIRELQIIQMPVLEDQLVEARAKLAATEVDLRLCRAELSMTTGSVEKLQIINDLTTEVDKQRELSRLHQRQLKEANADNAVLSRQLFVKEETEQVLQAELRALKSAMEILQGTRDHPARCSSEDEHLRAGLPETQSDGEGEESGNAFLVREAERLESANAGDRHVEDHQSSLASYEQFVKRRQSGRLEGEAQAISSSERLNWRQDPDQRANHPQDIELEHASSKETVHRYKSNFQLELSGRAALRERSNSFRSGSTGEHRMVSHERKAHRVSASEPTFDLTQAHLNESSRL